jgi:hypothetical protein
MEYGIEDIGKVKIGDSLIFDIDTKTGTFPDEYGDLIKAKNEELKSEMAAYIFSKDLKVRILFKDKNFKKIGIVVDNYKLERMQSELFKKGFYTIDVAPFTKTTTSITFPVAANQFEKKKTEIGAIVSLVEAHFKRRN